MKHKVLGFFRAFLVFTLVIAGIHLFLLANSGITGYSISDGGIVGNPMLKPILAILSLIVFIVFLGYRKRTGNFPKHIKIKNLEEEKENFLNE